MRRNNWKKYIIILIAFIVGLVANLAARAILPRLLPAGLQAWTGLLATLLEIVISVGIILIIIFTNHIGESNALIRADDLEKENITLKKEKKKLEIKIEKLEKENENLLKKKDECTRDADWERLGKAGI